MKIRIQELFACLFLGVLLNGAFAIRCIREPQNAHSPKSSADNRFEIRIRGNPDKYVAGGDYTVSLRGVRSGRYRPTFKRFMLVVQPNYSHNSYNIVGHRNVGSLSLIDDTISKFSNECPNAIIQTSSLTKSEIQVVWTAPPSDSGCVVFRATVVEDHDVWYMDDGLLSLVLCEDVREADIDQPDEVEKCCTCDDAMYEMVFEGIWTKHTHPKDFPSNKWETAFSDMIGASHSPEYHFWEYGDFASKGLRRLAQLGDTHELESEIMSHTQHVRTIIKARGLRYPNVTGRTYSAFRVDTQNHLMSIVSKIDPSPDWVVGVSGFNLCLKNCSWVQYKIINLYPWDVGSDSGFSYNSPKSPSNPQQPISRITTSYPNDPNSPFYDATGEEMTPLAQLHLIRQQLYEKPCNADDDGGDSEPEPEEMLVECMVTNWLKWTSCSESCGKGERLRQRSYLNRKKARAMGCTEELTESGECYGNHPSCRREESECEPMEWSPWGECSVTCGNGVETRTRRYRTRQEHKQCIGLPDSPELTETRDCVGTEGDTCDDTSQENDDCPQTEWSSWSPCSASCGKGKSVRTLISIEDEDGAEPSEDCPQAETIEEKDCMELPSCDIDEELYRELCLSPLKEGACNRNNNRWYFDADTKTCQSFVYRGCYGNRNNFLTQEDCENTCSRGSEEIEEDEEDTTLDGPIGGLWPASQIIDPKGTYGIQDSNIPNYVFGTQTEPYTAVDGLVADCVVGRWTRWSSCSVSCGTGYKMRNRKIVVHPRNGGLACPKVFKKKKCRKSCAPDGKY